MKWVRVQFLEGMDLNQWRLAHAFPPDTPIHLVWQAGLNWPEIVDALEAQPLPWQPEEEAKNKQIQEQYERIRQSEGLPAAMEWMRENVVKPLYGEGEV